MSVKQIHISWADVSKWGGILAMFCGALYMASQKKFDEAYALFCGAMAAAGIGAKVNTAVNVSNRNAVCLREIQGQVAEVNTAVQTTSQTDRPMPPPTECL